MYITKYSNTVCTVVICVCTHTNFIKVIKQMHATAIFKDKIWNIVISQCKIKY